MLRERHQPVAAGRAWMQAIGALVFLVLVGIAAVPVASVAAGVAGRVTCAFPRRADALEKTGRRQERER